MVDTFIARTPHHAPHPKAADIFPIGGQSTIASKNVYQRTSFRPHFKKISFSTIPLKKLYFTDASQDTEGLVGDVMWASRIIISQLPGSQLPSGIIADQLIGETTMTNFPRGLIKSAKAVDRLKTAHEIEDTEGTCEAGIDLATGGLQTAYGLDYIGIRNLTVHSAYLPSSTAAQAVSAVLNILTTIGNILFPISCAFTGAWGAFQAWRADKFYEEYKKNGKTFEFLAGSIFASPEKVAEMIEKEEESLQTEGETALKKAFGNQPIPEDAYWSATSEEKHQWLNALCAAHFQKYPELPALKELYFSKLSRETFNALELPTAVGLLLALRKLQQKNEARIERFLGQDCLTRIKKAAERGLTERAESKIPAVKKQALAERTELLEKVDSSYAETQTEYKTAKWLGIAGAALGIAAFFLGPYGLLALSLVFAIVCIVTDVHLLKGAFDNQPGSADKLFIAICAICSLLSIVGAIAAFVFIPGAPLVLLLLSLAAGGIGLCIYGYGYYKATQQEKKWKEEHPTLEDLADHLQRLRIAGRGRHKLDKKTLALFKKLPRAVRKALTADAAAQPFDTDSYRKWDSQSRFGQICLERYLKNQEECEQLRRSVKKTAKFFWNQWWYSNKQAFFQKQALLFEDLLEALKTNDLLRTQKAYQKIEESDSDIQDKLYENIRNVFKREESIHSLQEAITHIQQLAR
jgi:hypothetical protein